MPLRYIERILVHLAHDRYRPERPEEIAAALRVPEAEQGIFDQALARLASERKLEIGRDGCVRLPEMPDEIEGTIRVNRRGFGFVVPAARFREGDLFVPAQGVGDAVSGDRVRCAVRRQPWRQKAKPGSSGIVGRVVEVLERGRTEFTGTLSKQGTQWMVAVDGSIIREPVVVRDPHAKNAKVGDKVVIEMLHWPEGDYLAEGVIVRVLGEAGRPDVETQAVIETYALRTDFPENVVREAQGMSRKFDAEVAELTGGRADVREDLTERFIFTIDPTDSKDFDDAISIEFDEDAGTWELGIHIADVAHFVAAGGALDREAQERGNSVYLPRLVLPMLPEVLSNGVCSLQEGVPRFAKSVFVTLDRRAKVLSQRFASTLIRSAKRLTYLEAQALLDGDMAEARKQARTDTAHTPELIAKLRMSDRLARAIRARREGEGMIHLDLPQVQLVFDDAGHVADAEPEDDAFTHTIIEMFMVEANEAVARLFAQLDVPVLRRIHPDPAFADLEELRLHAATVQFRLPDDPTRHDLQALLAHTTGTPQARAVHFAVLRTLTRASYNPALIGHFALASEHYAHFTSPIRRYPDLLVHRALAAYLERTDNGRKHPSGAKRSALGRAIRGDERVPDEELLVALGRHCSDTEENAEDAEDALRTFLVLQFLKEHHLGEVFDGVVTGTTPNAVFISLTRFVVDGLVRVQDLPSSAGRADRWTLDDFTGRLVAGRSGASIGIGDEVKVRLDEIDPIARNMTLAIEALPERAAMETRRRETHDRHRREARGRGKAAKGAKKHGKGGKPGKKKRR